MGRRALIIALASFGVIVLGVVVVWAIISSGTPSAGPTPQPPQPDPVPSETLSPEPSETPTPTATPSPSPTAIPDDPPPAPVTALAAKPAPHSVRLDWKNPGDDDLRQLVVVLAEGKTPPADLSSGTVIAKLDYPAASYVDKSAGLTPGKKYSYTVFARDAGGALSTASGLTVTLPAAVVVTPVDVTGDVTQQAADGALTDSGSLAFTAFDPNGTRIAAVLPAAGVSGKVTRTLTEPVGAAPGAVVWTYTVQNSAIRSLGEGAKRDELFVIEVRDGKDKAPTTVTVTVRGINDAPTAASMPAQTAAAGDPFVFPIPAGTFTDVDVTDTLTLSAGILPGWLAFANDALTGTPSDADIGTTTVTITATDPHGASVSADVAIEVFTPLPAPNQPPVPVADPVTFDLGVDPLQTSAALLANDSDPDGGPNALAAIPAAGDWQVNGALAGSYTIDSAGTLHLDSGTVADGPLQLLASGEQATATITYSVTDGTDTVQSSVNITVIGTDSKAGEYDVAKVFVPQTEAGRELGARTHG
jgi:VCBS repeat-containing protein